MATVRYATLVIKNPSSISMQISVRDADGNEHTVVTLAPNQETTQFTPVDATWTITFDANDTGSRGGTGVVSDTGSRGGTGVVS